MMSVAVVFFILISVCLLDALPGPIGMIVMFIFINKHTQNFVLKPLAKYLSENGNSPNNYMYRKLQNIRCVIWILAIIFDMEMVYFMELGTIALSYKIINSMKNKMFIPIEAFSKDDYKIYNEYSEYMKKGSYSREKVDGYTKKQSYSYEDIISGKNIKVNLNRKEEISKTQIKKVEIKKDEIEKTDSNIFDKPIGDIKTEFSNNLVNKTDDVNRFNFNKPIADISATERIQETSGKVTEPTELKPDEIRCEKCGTIMSKHKVACPKCGTLVKNTYKTGK